jgi:4-hydroxybenzoate polyprenyltransferase
MSKTDKIKEEIGWLKVIFSILVATDISLIAWLVKNYENADKTFLILCSIAIVMITCAVVWVNRIAYKKIDELEGL